MTRKPLKGPFPLMPFVVHANGELDLKGLKHNIGLYEKAGVPGYIVFGCMGECYAPSFAEFCRVVDTAMETTKGMAVVVGVTYHNTTECVRRAQYAEQAGADGVMAGPPYLIPCSNEAAVAHYRRLNDAVGTLQILVYNNPGSFHFNMTRELWDQLMTLDNVKAVKESNGDTGHRANVIAHIAHRINVFSGSEHWFLADSLVGANSFVGIAAPGALAASLAYYDACMKRDLATAIPFYIKYNDLVTEITGQNEVAWLKACAECGGLRAGPPRLPYQPLDATIRKRLEKKLKGLRNLATSHGPSTPAR
jgi:dihydrodipicolinate synthase/N-acetylneuraminate lyase